MSNELLAVAGITSGIINTIGTVPYVVDIFRGKTKPERAMWWVYSALFTVLFVAQMDAQAGWLLVATGGYIFSSTLIAVLSLRYGYGKFHLRDTISLAVAALGLLAWQLTNSPLLAIIMVVIVDFAGFWLTLVKTWHAPHSETLIAWQLSLVATLFSIVSISKWSWAVIIYPLYALVGGTLIVWLIMYRRTKVAEDTADF